MPIAKKLPSGTYRCLIYMGKDETGKKKYKSFTDRDKKRCETKASEYADKHRVIYNGESFQTCMNSYILSRKAVLSPSTIRGYRNMEKSLKNDFGAFCETDIHEITKDGYQLLINKMVEDGLSSKTIRNRSGFISSVLKYKGVEVPQIKLPDKAKSNRHIPELSDVQRIIEVAKDTEMEIPILLAAFAPLRRSEIVALTMDDVKGDTIHIRKAVVMDENGKNISKNPKTYESDRYILMPSKIMNRIREKGYITDIKNPQIISQRFEHIAKRAGCAGVRFHDLRHFCASYLHAQGVPEQYILERGGWTTDGVMKSIYRHSLASESDKINRNLIGKLDSVL